MAYTELSSIIADSFGVSVGAVTGLLVVVGIWSLVWKGLALWKSSKKNQLVWFVILLVVNTVGILEILYIFIFSKMNLGNVKSSSKKITKKGRK